MTAEQELDVKATLAAALPKGEGNGLAPYSRQLADFPRKVRPAIVFLDCLKSTLKHNDDTTTITVRIKRIELITDPDDAKIMQRMLERALEARTGQTTLPFDMEVDIRTALEGANIDPDVLSAELLDEAIKAAESVEPDPTAGPWPGDADA